MKKMTKWLTVPASLCLVVAGLLAPATPAHADEGHHYPIAFTGGVGLRMRTAPTMASALDVAYPEGYQVSASCQDVGEWVTNRHGESSNIWVRSNGGTWWPTAYLYTGVTFWIDGLISCTDKDAALEASLNPPKKTVADYHREGRSPIMTLDPGELSGRVYFSKSGTKEAASALNKANEGLFWRDTLTCATAGVLVGQAATAVSVGFGADIGCSLLMGVFTPSEFDSARGAANAAASAGKCYEVRMRRAHRDAEWRPETWTVTDHQDYCA